MSSAYTLTRTGAAPLRFEGELVAKATSYSRDGPLQNRWHEIEVYACLPFSGGRHVVHVEFSSRWQGESGHHAVEVFDAPDSLAEFLQSYDWRQGWENYPAGPDYADRRERNERAIAGGYARAVSDVLAGFPEELATRVAEG